MKEGREERRKILKHLPTVRKEGDREETNKCKAADMGLKEGRTECEEGEKDGVRGRKEGRYRGKFDR